MLPHVGLRHRPHREENLAQCPGSAWTRRRTGPSTGRHPGRSCCRPKLTAAGHLGAWCPVARRIETESLAPGQQAVELDVAVAFNTRIGRAAGGMSRDVRIDLTWRSKSSVRLKSWCAIPCCCATRLASSSSATEQHPESVCPPQSLSVAPTTSWPCSTSRAAATEELDAARHGHQHSHPTSVPPASDTSAKPGVATSGTTHRVRLDIGPRRAPAEREAHRAPGQLLGRPPWRPARGWAAALHWRTTSRPRHTRPARPGPPGVPPARCQPDRGGGDPGQGRHPVRHGAMDSVHPGQ